MEEQQALDENDDIVSELNIRIQLLIKNQPRPQQLNGVKTSLLKSDATMEDPVMQDQTQADKLPSDCLLLIKKRLCSNTTMSKTTSSATKLPKLELLTFYGDIYTAMKELLGAGLCLSSRVYLKKRS